MRPYWVIILVGVALGLVGRVAVHRMDDSARGQRMGSRTWTALLLLIVIMDLVGYVVGTSVQPYDCATITPSEQLPANVLFPLLSIAITMINGSYGLCFVHKAALVGLMMLDCLTSTAICILCAEAALAYEVMLVVGFVVVHLAEMRWRRSYVEKLSRVAHERRLQNEERQERRGLEQRNEQLLQTSNDRLRDSEQRNEQLQTSNEEERQERRGLEQRNEQLQTSNERLLGLEQQTSNERVLGLEQRNEQLQTSNERLRYDMQRRGRPLDDDDERSDIRRGLQAGTCQFKRTKSHSSEAGGLAPSESPPPSFPPGAPSSTASGSLGSGGGGATMCYDASAVHLLVGADASGAGGCQVGKLEHRVLPSARAEAAGLGFAEVAASPSEMEAGRAADALADMAMAFGGGRAEQTQQKVQQKGGQKRLLDLVQVDTSPAASAPAPAHAMPTFEQALEEARHRPTPEQALEEARHLIEAAHTEAEVFQVVYPLAVALGAKRTETGTVKALHGVLLQLVRPGLSNAEACTAVGASMSNFCKWRRKIQFGVFP